jgi:molecular chaperone DnaK
VGERVPADERGRVEAALRELREALKGEDVERIKRATEALQQTSFKLGEEMYRRTAAGAGAGGAGAQAGGGAGSAGGDDVIDAEFKPSDKP